MQLGRSTVLALGKKVKKSRNMQISSIYNSNTMICDRKVDPASLQNSLTNTNINPSMKMIRNISRSIKNYKPPRHGPMGFGKKSVILASRNSFLGHDKSPIFVDHRPSASSVIKNFTTLGGEDDLLDRFKVSSDISLKPFNTLSPQYIHDSKLNRHRSNYTNFCRYKNLTDLGNKNVLTNMKLMQNPMINPKKTRNNMTLDGMNSSSLEILKK